MRKANTDLELDFYNYHSLELLEKLGEYAPSQVTIDTVANFLEKVSKLTNSNLSIVVPDKKSH